MIALVVGPFVPWAQFSTNKFSCFALVEKESFNSLLLCLPPCFDALAHISRQSIQIVPKLHNSLWELPGEYGGCDSEVAGTLHKPPNEA
jgi:hypothetical protein